MEKNHEFSLSQKIYLVYLILSAYSHIARVCTNYDRENPEKEQLDNDVLMLFRNGVT